MQFASYIQASLSAEDIPMASDSRDEAGALNVGTLGSFAFSIGSARQMFDDEDLQMLVYTGTGQGMDGDEASAPGGVLDAAHTGFLGWSNSGPKATEGPEGYSQPLQPPTSCEDSYIRESDNQSIRSSAPSVFDRNSGGMMSHRQQSIGQLPVLHGTHSNDYESLPVREGSVDDGSHGSAGVKKRARKTDSKNKRLPGTMRGPFHPSGPCLLTDMTDEFKALERVLTMSSLPLEIAEEAAEQVYVPKRGKGGRNPALDARLDPNIDPKKAARIMANRLSAARSKMRRKMMSHTEGLQSKLVLLESQKHRLEREVERLDKLCKAMEVEVYGKGVASNRVLGQGGVLKGSAGIAFEVDFENPMGAAPMNFILPTTGAPPPIRHQHSSSWSHMNSAFNNNNNNNMDAFNNGNVEGWQQQPQQHQQQLQLQASGGFDSNMIQYGGLPDPAAALQVSNSMPQVYLGP